MDKVMLGSISLYQVFWYFLIFSFLGWCSEVIFATLKSGKFVNRGFLCGPVCPIYGCGVVIVLLALQNVLDSWWWLFFGGALVATLLEFVTGFVLEKIFHTRWWDYSKEPFNVKGYICLRFTILWGIAILLLFRTIVAFIRQAVDLIPYKIGLPVLILLVAIFVADIVITILQLTSFTKKYKELEKFYEKMHVSSNFIGEKLSSATEVVREKAVEAKAKADGEKQAREMKERILKTRLAHAFPSLADKVDKMSDGEDKEEKS